MRAIPQRQPLFLGGSIGGVPSFDLNFARGDNAVTKYGFTFTRATAATYVNAAGLIATAASGELRYTYDPVTLSALGVLIEEQRTNLVNRSEALNNGSFWSPVRTTPTPSATTGPDGVANSSCSILETAVTNTFHIDFSFTPAATTTYACSVFFKGGLGRGYATMDVSGGGGATGSCTINLTTGAVTAGSGTVQSYPNGWWRVSFTTTTVTTAPLAMRLWCSNDGTASPSYAGDITKGIYAWGAQIEVGAFITSYIPSISASATRNADVLSLTGAAGRTNLLTYSQDISQSSWAKARGTADTTSTTDPTGSATTTSKFAETATTGAHTVSQTSIAVTNGAAYTFTVYVKSAERTWIDCGFTNFGAAGTDTWFDVTNTSVGTKAASHTASITDVGGGWRRITISASTTSTSVGIYLSLSTGDGVSSYTGTLGSGLYIWGAQLEAGSSATAYIPTTSGPRTVENVASWFNGDAGTMYAEYRSNGVTSQTSNVFAFYDIGASGTNRILLYHSNAGKAQTQIDSQSSAQMTSSSSMTAVTTAGTRIQAALAYAKDDGAISAQGASATADTSLILPVGMYQCGIGRSNYATALFNGTISRLRYYPRRLPNATLKSLTS